MRATTRADVYLNIARCAWSFCDLRAGIQLFAAVTLAATLMACAQSPLVTNPTALQGANRQKSMALAHMHRHLTTHARMIAKEGASYGLASFYGEGSETASGEKFDPKGLTAAHPTLPFGTRLRVTNIANGRSVIVRVNDRGPFVAGRAVDVSSSAAERIGIVERGVAKVKLDVVQ
jgi:rare lipoprotein A